MVTYSMNIGLERMAVAEEAISSVARILSAAGFDHQEIAELLRSGASQLDSMQAATSEVEEEIWGCDDEDVYSILERYENTNEIKSLKRLSKRASAIGSLDELDHREKTYEILAQALPIAKLAIDWLIAESAAKGVQVRPNREQWLSSAEDDELDKEDEILFLDDWQVTGDFQFQLIQELSHSYAMLGDRDGFRKLWGVIENNSLLYDSRTLESVNDASEALQAVETFKTFLLRYAGAGEQMQSAIFDEFIRETGFAGGTYMLEGWLDSLSETGLLQRYKRSNRWRVVLG